MELALMVEPQDGGTYEELLKAAQWAEAAGLAAFARSDHYYVPRGSPEPADDAFTALGGIARETSTIALVLLVSPITFRHPAVIAKAAATLNDMSGGRFDLGIGTGWSESEHEVFGLPFPSQAERFARLSEAIPYVISALRDDSAKFNGEYYQLNAEVRPLAPEVGIIVGGSGKVKTPALAGRWASEYNLIFRPPQEVGARIQTMREAAVEAGRDADLIRCSLMGPAIIGSDEADLGSKLLEAANSREISADELRERYAKAGLIVGTADQAREQLSALEAVGVDRVYLQSVPHTVDRLENLFGPLL